MIRNDNNRERLDIILDTDDLEPQLKKKNLKNLDTLSVEALHEYIDDLNDEIKRVETTIKFKEGAKEQADTFFKS